MFLTPKEDFAWRDLSILREVDKLRGGGGGGGGEGGWSGEDVRVKDNYRNYFDKFRRKENKNLKYTPKENN